MEGESFEAFLGGAVTNAHLLEKAGYEGQLGMESVVPDESNHNESSRRRGGGLTEVNWKSSYLESRSRSPTPPQFGDPRLARNLQPCLPSGSSIHVKF